jgi:hypothetical protein
MGEIEISSGIGAAGVPNKIERAFHIGAAGSKGDIELSSGIGSAGLLRTK